MSPSDERTPAGRVLAALGKLLALAAAAAVAAAVVVVLVLPRAVQGEAMTVLTGSMEPAIPVGSVALVRPVDPRTIEVGDVVTYQVRPNEETFVTHRVVRVRDRGPQTLYVLRGDANNVADEPILGDRIRGEVWFHVPHLGTVRDALHGRGGLYLVATILLAWFALSQIGGGLRERRESRWAASREAGSIIPERPLAVVELEPDLLAARGETPARIAERLGGLVLAAEATSWTILLPSGDDLDRHLEELAPREVRRVQVVAVGAVPQVAPA